ncbi:hypothetical protein Tco_1502607 [Tanacetum coccineum]
MLTLQGTPTDQLSYLSSDECGELMYSTTSQPEYLLLPSLICLCPLATLLWSTHSKRLRDLLRVPKKGPLTHTFVCARYQARPMVKHLKETQTMQDVKTIEKSTSEGLQFLGEKLVSWSSKKQDCTVMSTVEAEIIMAQPQRQADVHQDELCPPNKCYALMDANKKIDLDNPLCPNESKILANILQNHPLRFSIAASSSVPWIYLGQFWHTLKEDRSKYRLTFVLDRKELTMTLGDFRTIFQLPQATYNNHERFVAAPKFTEMVPFFLNDLGITLELRSTSNFKTTSLVQPWQTLCKLFSRRLTTRVTSYDQPPLQIMKMLVDVPTTQSQPIESTQGPHRTTSAPRSPNPDMDKGESSAQRKSTKSRDDLEAQQNVEKVNEHLVAEEIKKMVEGSKSEYADESGGGETDVVQPVNVIKEEEESAENDYELRRRVKGKNVEEFRNTPSPTTIRPPRIHSTLISSDTEKLQELTTRFLARKKFYVLAQHLQELMEESLPKMNQADVAKIIADAIQQDHKNLRAVITSQINNAITNHIPFQVDSSVRNYMSDNPQLQHDDLPIWLALKIKFKGLHTSNTPCRSSAIRPRDQDDPHYDAPSEGENSAKRQKTSKHGTYVFGESSSGQANESEPGPSISGNQEQLDDFDFWTNTYATDDDELPAEKVSQKLVEEMSKIVDEAKLRKVVNETLRQ